MGHLQETEDRTVILLPSRAVPQDRVSLGPQPSWWLPFPPARELWGKPRALQPELTRLGQPTKTEFEQNVLLRIIERFLLKKEKEQDF